eukprot:173276-Pyramimonas_sp.AAC.1
MPTVGSMRAKCRLSDRCAQNADCRIDARKMLTVGSMHAKCRLSDRCTPALSRHSGRYSLGSLAARSLELRTAPLFVDERGTRSSSFVVSLVLVP